MVTTPARTERETVAGRSVDASRDHSTDLRLDRVIERHVHTEPMPQSWGILAVGALVPLGLAGAAVATSSLTKNERVGVASWVAVAVAGTAAIISAAAVSHRRTVSLDFNAHGGRTAERCNERSRE